MNLIIAELREQCAILEEEAKEIYATADKEQRDLTPEQTKRFEETTARAKFLKADIKRREDLEALTTIVQPAAKPASPNQIERSANMMHPWIEVVRFGGKLHGNWGETRSQANENAYSSGRWLLATLWNHPESRDWCANRGIQLRTMTTTVDTAGGYLVPDVMESVIIDLREKYGAFRANTAVRPMSSDTDSFPRVTSDTTVYFPQEGVAPTATQVGLDQVRLTAREAACLVYYSRNLSEDAIISMADLLTRNIAWSFAKKEDDCGFIGTGAGATYAGMSGVAIILLDGTKTASYTTAANLHDTGAEYDEIDLVNMMAKLPSYAYDGAKWFCHPAVKAATFDRLKMKAGGNTAIILGQGVPDTFMGYPIVTTPSMNSALAESTAIDILFGRLDLAMMLGERRGFTVELDRSYKFAEGLLTIKATSRFDIKPQYLGDTSTAGPIVGLQAH